LLVGAEVDDLDVDALSLGGLLERGPLRVALADHTDLDGLARGARGGLVLGVGVRGTSGQGRDQRGRDGGGCEGGDSAGHVVSSSRGDSETLCAYTGFDRIASSYDVTARSRRPPRSRRAPRRTRRRPRAPRP